MNGTDSTNGTAALRPASRRSFLGGAGALALGVSALAAPGTARAQETITTNRTGTHDGYFYSFWTDSSGPAAMTLEPGGGYTTRWGETATFTCGKGWETGSRRTVTWSGDYLPAGDSYLLLYGWSANPLVEYCVVESYGDRRPLGEHRGTFSTDGATYDIQLTVRQNAVSPEGIRTVPRFWSVIRSPRTSGTIDTGAHFDAWSEAGLQLGHLGHYMIFAVDGYRSSGHADIRVG